MDLGCRVQGESYLKPKSMQNDSPKPLIIARKAITLQILGVQVNPEPQNTEP